MKKEQAQSNIFSNFLYLIKPFWKCGKIYMFLMIVPAIIFNSAISFIDVRFTEHFINAITVQDWRLTLYTILVFQGSYFLIMITSDVINLLFVPIQYQKASRKISKTIYHKARHTDIKYFDNPDFYDKYTWTSSQYIGKGDSCITILKNFLSQKEKSEFAWILKGIITTAIVYCAASLVIPWGIPFFVTLANLGAGTRVLVYIVIALLGVIIFRVVALYVRAIKKRKDFFQN